MHPPPQFQILINYPALLSSDSEYDYYTYSFQFPVCRSESPSGRTSSPCYTLRSPLTCRQYLQEFNNKLFHQIGSTQIQIINYIKKSETKTNKQILHIDGKFAEIYKRIRQSLRAHAKRSTKLNDYKINDEIRRESVFYNCFDCLSFLYVSFVHLSSPKQLLRPFRFSVFS